MHCAHMSRMTVQMRKRLLVGSWGAACAFKKLVARVALRGRLPLATALGRISTSVIAGSASALVNAARRCGFDTGLRAPPRRRHVDRVHRPLEVPYPNAFLVSYDGLDSASTIRHFATSRRRCHWPEHRCCASRSTGMPTSPTADAAAVPRTHTSSGSFTPGRGHRRLSRPRCWHLAGYAPQNRDPDRHRFRHAQHTSFQSTLARSLDPEEIG